MTGSVVQTTSMLASPTTDTAVAVGTSAAAGIALATLAFLCYQWAKDKRERRALEERKQAALINCWFTETSTEFPGPAENSKYRITGKLEWLNRSDDPVYSVLILGRLATKEIGGYPLAPKRQSVAATYDIPIPVIAPGNAGSQEYAWTFDVNPVSTLVMEFVLSWQFNDSRGVTWLKNSQGYMEKIKPSPEARNRMAAASLPVVEDLARSITDITNEAKANEIRAEKQGNQSEADTVNKPQD